MIRKFFAFTILVLMAGVLFAQDPKTVTITGNLIDNNCAESAKDLGARAKTHSTSCAMMEGCAKTGYAVYGSDNKLYKFDSAGNDSAADLLKNTKTTKGVKVSVEGTVTGDTIKVTKLTEVTDASN